MVTTRAGSRAASEVSTPAKSPPPTTPRRTRRIKAELGTDADATPSRTSTTARPLRLGATARRRARQKDRVRALRSARGDGWPALADVEPALAAKLRATLGDLLAALDAQTETICPSRAPRAIAATDDMYPDWTALVGAARAVARDMAEKGEARLVSDAEGPVRIGRVW